MKPIVTSVSLNPIHEFSKYPQSNITLLAGIGVQGDAHSGKTTQHLYLVKKDPTRLNLTQVHILHAELHDEFSSQGFTLLPGQMGENITTRGIELMTLPTGALLRVGESVILEATGLREPCSKLDKLASGLMKAVLKRDKHGDLHRNAGIMTIVLQGGTVQPRDAIEIELPAEPHRPLQPV